MVSSATLEETALSEVAAGFRRRGGRGSDVAPWLTPLSLSGDGFDLILFVLTRGFLFGIGSLP